MLFHDPERLRHIAQTVGPIQIVYGGKAHPRDEGGKNIIRQIFGGAVSVADAIRTVYVENYDMVWGRLMTSGVDVWLNNPVAAARSIRYEWNEGCPERRPRVSALSTAGGLRVSSKGLPGGRLAIVKYRKIPRLRSLTCSNKLEEIVPMFYKDSNRYIDIMRMSVPSMSSFFNTQRMVQQYVTNAYLMRSDALRFRSANAAQDWGSKQVGHGNCS